MWKDVAWPTSELLEPRTDHVKQSHNFQNNWMVIFQQTCSQSRGANSVTLGLYLSVSNHCVFLNKLRQRRPQIAKKNAGSKHSKAAASWSGALQRHPAPAPLQRHQEPSSKAKTTLWQQHLAAHATTNKTLKRKLHSGSSAFQRHSAAAPCGRTSNQAPEKKQHSDSTTLQQHPATAPAAKLQSTNNSDGSTLQRHPAAAPCRGALQRHLHPNSTQLFFYYWNQKSRRLHGIPFRNRNKQFALTKSAPLWHTVLWQPLAAAHLLHNHLRNPVDPDLALHRGLPPSPEASPEPSPESSPEPSPELSWT